MLNYIFNKQARIMNSISYDFVREQYIQKLSAKSRLVGLIGQRGVGKTTLLLQYLKNNFKVREYIYFSADDVHIMDSSIYDIVDEFVRLGGRAVAIDEVHRYKNWAQELKSIYDSFPELIIRFSGSSMLNILHEKYDLSRRVVVSHVTPLSFREFMALSQGVELPLLTFEEILQNHNEISVELALKHPQLYKNFLKYLQIGAYPFFIEDEEEYKNKLFNAFDKIINEDIPSLNRVEFEHLSIFKNFIAKIVYAKVPLKVNITELSREFGISHPTLSGYITILEQTKVVNAVRKYSQTISKKPQKLLFGNSNILYTYSDEFGVEVDVGTVRETFFCSCFEGTNEKNRVYYSDIGDFKVGEYIFEVGGKNKSFSQIKDIKNSFLAIDTDYTMEKNKIPLWLFGLIG